VHHPEKVAILVGGGPAPGINSVISAAAIRCALEGVEVLGCHDGFQWLMDGNIDHVEPLSIEDVSRIHFRGGSHLGTSRANPTKNPVHLENTVLSLLRMDVTMLITIGGDDTAFSAMRLAEKAGGRQCFGRVGRARSVEGIGREGRGAPNLLHCTGERSGAGAAPLSRGGRGR
jgi:6-phosphofructokinase